MRYMKLQLKQLKLFSSPDDFCVKMYIISYGLFRALRNIYNQQIHIHSIR